MKSFVIARTPIQYVDKDQPLSYALEIMDSKDLSALPVVDNGKFIGIITIRGIMDRIWSERVRIVNLSSLYVSSVMETNVPRISMDTTLIEACNLMIKCNSIALPILYDDKPIGMIFEEDIPRLFFDSNIDSSGFINRRFRVVDLDSNILHIRSLMRILGLYL
ncbi:MAG: CBS domain-containing protein [Sulfolobales archaeon]